VAQKGIMAELLRSASSLLIGGGRISTQISFPKKRLHSSSFRIICP